MFRLPEERFSGEFTQVAGIGGSICNNGKPFRYIYRIRKARHVARIPVGRVAPITVHRVVKGVVSLEFIQILRAFCHEIKAVA